ncbi:MAG: MerR family transcriptional regulator [Deltaproteobacteria bacterium]|nr:MerR family transcriptional regulator [Deltaproteobacteria bacterium]
MKNPEDKRYYRIGEVSRIIGLEPYVLKYWEMEFPQIRPSRADSKQRTYQKKEVELIKEIKHLLYDEKLTIEGARKRLKKTSSQTEKNTPACLIKEIKNELKEITLMLGD